MPGELSSRTVAILVELIADGHTHTTLQTFFMKLGVDGFVPDSAPNKEAKVHGVIARVRASKPEEEVQRILRAMAAEFLPRFDVARGLPNHVEPLVKGLNSDGWIWNGEALVPATPAPADLAPEIEGLERELSTLVWDVAASHYSQAVANFREGRFEASNGQLRSFLENLLIEICARVEGRAFTDPTAAVQHLKARGSLEGGEYNMARGLLDMSNRRGAHHGLTDRGEALFRLHFSTAFARYLLARLGLTVN